MALLSGCAGFDADVSTIEELEVELLNGSETTQTFHFVVETADGVGAWESREIPADTSEVVVAVEPDAGAAPVAVYGVVDDQTARGELLDLDQTDRSTVCPRLVFEYGVDDEPAFLQSSDVRC